jgi:hypothetical protein
VVDLTKRIVGSLGFKIDTDNNGNWDHESPVTPELDGTRTETITVSGSDDQYWRFGIEGHGVKWHRLIEQHQYKEARIEYEMSVSINFGQGFGTIEIPALEKDAIVADLRFAEPTEEYSMGNISMMKPVYNINAINWQPGSEPPLVPEPQSSGFGWWLLILILLVIIVVVYIIARQQPESAAGKRIRHMYHAAGVARVVDRTKGVTRSARDKVLRKEGPRPEVVEPEMVVVEEEPIDVVEDKPKEDKAPPKKTTARKTSAKKASTKKDEGGKASDA